MVPSLAWIDPKSLERFERLELVARSVVEGYVSGLHRSPFHGSSIEFAEHRQYVQGDEIRRLDWKVLGKTDRHYIKKYEEETNLRCYVLLDASGSMAYGSGAANKLDYGRHVAAALGYLVLRQRDSIGLLTFDTIIRSYLPPRSTPQHLRILFEELSRLEPGKDTGISGILHDFAERIRRRGLVVVVSDFFDDPSAILAGLAHFRHRRHEVVAVKIVHPDEARFPFHQWTLFEGLEPLDGKTLTEPQRIRESYLREFRRHTDDLRRGCLERNIDYVEMETGGPYDAALATYLSRRLA